MNIILIIIIFIIISIIIIKIISKKTIIKKANDKYFNNIDLKEKYIEMKNDIFQMEIMDPFLYKVHKFLVNMILMIDNNKHIYDNEGAKYIETIYNMLSSLRYADDLNKLGKGIWRGGKLDINEMSEENKQYYIKLMQIFENIK